MADHGPLPSPCEVHFFLAKDVEISADPWEHGPNRMGEVTGSGIKGRRVTLFVGESRLEAANLNLMSASESWDGLAKGERDVGEKTSFPKEISE